MLEFFSMISDFVKTLIDGIGSFIKLLGEVPQIIEDIAGVLPPSFLILIGIIIPLVIILKIIDR